MDGAIHKRLAQCAEGFHVSINELCLRFIRSGLEGGSKDDPWWKKEGMGLVDLIRRRFGGDVVGIAAFGSQVSGTATASSDLDILIVLDAHIPLSRSFYSWWDEAVPQKNGGEINPQFVHLPKETKEAGGIWLEAALVLHIFWERGRKLSSFIARLKELISSDLVRRYWLNGQPYWVRRDI